MRRRHVWIAIVGAALVSQFNVADALASPVIDGVRQPLGPQVTGLTAVQHSGFTTLKWNPEAGATEYAIVRTPVDANNLPTGPPEAVGVWRSNRTVTPNSPTWADAGFVLGGRYEWRVSVLLPTPGLPSDPVYGTTLSQFGTGVAALRTEWETNGNIAYTSDVDEYTYTAALDAASHRVRAVEIGRTVLNRPINMFVIGYPAPLGTPQEISNSPTFAVSCVVHGNEPSGVDACMIMARELAFTQDQHLLDILSSVTVLLVLGLNGDGRAANTRGNSTGQDLNRDHSLIRQPETKAFATFLRDYTPQVLIDSHHGDTEDLPILGPRHANVAFSIYDEAKAGMIEGWMYDHAALEGWWMGPYNNGGLGEETILRNTSGLKNAIAMLAESRPDGGDTRPGEGTPAANLRRLVYGHMWEFFQGLEYHYARLPQIESAIAQSIAFQTSNTGRIVFRGSWPWPPFPSVGQEPPAEDAPTSGQILDPPPCGYLLTEEQYRGARTGGTVELRLQLHGITVQPRTSGYFVPLAQPQRGLIPLLLDAQAAEEILGATRVFPGDVVCGPTAVTVRSFGARAAGKSVVLRWRTGSELGVLGFNVYRQRGGTKVRLNRALIAARGLQATPSAGYEYTFRDRAGTGARYWLEEVRGDGSRRLRGPVRPTR